MTIELAREVGQETLARLEALAGRDPAEAEALAARFDSDPTFTETRFDAEIQASLAQYRSVTFNDAGRAHNVYGARFATRPPSLTREQGAFVDGLIRIVGSGGERGGHVRQTGDLIEGLPA